MGDVLRTTALLDDIRNAHPQAFVTWFTAPESVPLLRSVPGVDRIVDFTQGYATVESLRFDVLYSLDNAHEGVALAAALKAEIKRGFKMGRLGQCEGVYSGGDDTLFELGLWDDLKKKNRESYLKLLAASAGLKYSGNRPKLRLAENERAEAEAHFGALPHPRVGINTDAGARWLRKQWNLPYVETAVDHFVARGYGVILYGGAGLEPFNAALAARYPGFVESASTARNVRGLFAAVAQADVLLTGDTLAMHAAWALGVPIVALFGPTSAPEIDLASHDIKMTAEGLDCLGCYRHTCEVDPHCMDRLTPESVVRAVEFRLARLAVEAGTT